MDDLSRFCCLNCDCPEYGKRGGGNLTVKGNSTAANSTTQIVNGLSVTAGGNSFTIDKNAKTDQLNIDQPNNDFRFYELDLHRKQ